MKINKSVSYKIRTLVTDRFLLNVFSIVRRFKLSRHFYFVERQHYFQHVRRDYGSVKFHLFVNNAMISFFSKLSLNNTQKQSVEIAKPAYMDKSATLQELGYKDENDLKETIYDFLRTIRDPEKPNTLEDLKVIYEEGIFVNEPTPDRVPVLRVEYNPTVPHCSLATLIGLCIRIKIQRSIHHPVKLDIFIKKGAHTTEDEINKQINDKERIAAAMENPNLRNLVENCIADEE